MDLAAERAHGEFILSHAGPIDACTDLSDGGLALAAFEMAEAGGIGVTLDTGATARLFGEDQGRYLIACGEAEAAKLKADAEAAGLAIEQVGRFGGDEVRFGRRHVPLADMVSIYRSSFAEAVG